MKSEALPLCPRIEAAFSLIAKKWTGLILFSLAKGELRFGEIEGAIPGMSARLLSLRMKELESEGLIERRVRTELSPVWVSYCLTERGRSLSSLLELIADWATAR
jgi:DNA-binding HxlR family transcriptional regulator